jgi:hypothetical protein
MPRSVGRGHLGSEFYEPVAPAPGELVIHKGVATQFAVEGTAERFIRHLEGNQMGR